MEKEILIANIKIFEKTNEDGSTWRANIIDGLIFGLGCVSVFVPVNNIEGTIKENSQYPCILKPVIRNNKLSLDLIIKGE